MAFRTRQIVVAKNFLNPFVLSLTCLYCNFETPLSSNLTASSFPTGSVNAEFETETEKIRSLIYRSENRIHLVVNRIHCTLLFNDTAVVVQY